MDETPHGIREQIEHTRASLDRHLDELGAHVRVGRERLVAGTQWWMGLSAVAAGALGIVWFWPRQRASMKPRARFAYSEPY
jgi:hypothetical protein